MWFSSHLISYELLFCSIGTGLYVPGADFLGHIFMAFLRVYPTFAQPFASGSLGYHWSGCVCSGDMIFIE